MNRSYHLVRCYERDGKTVEYNVQSFDTFDLARNGAERVHESEVYSSQPARTPIYRYVVRHNGLIVWDSDVASPHNMPRQRRMIEIVMKSLREAGINAESKWKVNLDCPNYKAYVTLACAVDEALADLEHSLSDMPCNHGACLNTTLSDGSPAHTDRRKS